MIKNKIKKLPSKNLKKRGYALINRLNTLSLEKNLYICFYSQILKILN